MPRFYPVLKEPMTITSLDGTRCIECGHGILRALPDRGGIDCGIACDNCDRWWLPKDRSEAWTAERNRKG